MVGDRRSMTAKSTRIGFILPPGHWLGGKNYLRNLFAAMRSLPDRNLIPVLFTGERQFEAPADFPDAEVIPAALFDRKTPAWFARKLVQRTTGQDVLLRRLLQRHDVSVLSHSSPLGRQKAISTIGWIPDFQHLHLPEFFTPEEHALRDREFMALCAGCDRIVVSSKCAHADLRAFAPAFAHKAELLRFVASPVPLANAAALADLQQLYHFAGSYFLLPNQFWAHKNHRVVIAALQRLKQQGQKVLVLATGSSEDFRNPTFFSSLMDYAAECDVLDCFRVLGQIPFHHLAGLMQHAVAFINPSLFEGWSTSVEEAKSMGKQIVLSDLDVHREQAPERGIFFAREDPDNLAQALASALAHFDEQEDAILQAKAQARFPERQQEFGRAYQGIINSLG